MSSTESFTVREAVPFIGENDPITLNNPYLASRDLTETDPLHVYHFGLDTDDLPVEFANVKYVLMGGSAKRAKNLALKIHEEWGYPIHRFESKPNLKNAVSDANFGPYRRWIGSKLKQALGVPVEIGSTERYSLYLVGDTMVVNHGMGLGSISILLHEVTILLHAAGAKGVEYFRIGTSGGYGEDAGKVVIANSATSDKLSEVNDQAYWPKTVAGKTELWRADADPNLIDELEAVADESYTMVARTMAKRSFYGAEARQDGAVCHLTKEEAEAFFIECRDQGILNSEMEAGEFYAITRQLGIRGAVVCVILDNALKHDTLSMTKEEKKEYSRRAEKVVLDYILRKSGTSPKPKDVSWLHRAIKSILI